MCLQMLQATSWSVGFSASSETMSHSKRVPSSGEQSLARVYYDWFGIGYKSAFSPVAYDKSGFVPIISFRFPIQEILKWL